MAARARSPQRSLFDLAQLLRVQTSYRDAFGRYNFVDPDALRGVLGGLGLHLDSLEQAPRQLDEKLRTNWDWTLEPACVLWDGAGGSVTFRVPQDTGGTLTCTLLLEDGDLREWPAQLEDLRVEARKEIGGRTYVARSLPLPPAPNGYHRLHVELTGRQWQSFVIAAPLRAYEPEGRFRGAFSPLYALHSERSWGIGDVTDLRRFAAWVDKCDGDFVATLPLLPAYLERDHFSPSPYSPVSRLFWNELYADPVAAARGRANAGALAWYEQQETQQRLQVLRETPIIDYQGAWELKRRMLGLVANDMALDGLDPSVAEYARFRAARERQRQPWKAWPERLKRGSIEPGDFDQDTFALFAAGQQIIAGQLRDLSSNLTARRQQCYLDLPIGCEADGFDTWKYQYLFAHTVQCGAPPDRLFTQGQAWGLPPMIPDVMRRSGYDYLRAVIRHHLGLADILRYDHVIGLHRLYWVPDGFSARQGIFVQYPAEELYAILSLESHRAQSVIVGENLGTVPRRINAAMARHGIYETYVLQYEIPLDPAGKVRPAPRRSLAGLNTHDMPTFAGFLRGKDLLIQEDLGIREHESVLEALEERQQQVETLCRNLEEQDLLEPGDRDPERVYNACLNMIAGGRAKYVVINLEDLWLETEGHNVPGTATGNWQRRLALTMDEFPRLP